MDGHQDDSFGFVGLGNMGSQMAHNLAKYVEGRELPRVRVWNRTRSKIEELAKSSFCEPASSLSEVAQSCNIVHSCLANDAVALDVYRELFASAKEGAIFVDHSTLYPDTAETLQGLGRQHNVHFLSSPVFGPPAAAKSAQLLLTVSGDAKARERVKEHLVPALGKGVMDCGDATRKAALLKILGNNCILGTIELLSESFTLAEKTGFDVSLFYEFIRKLLSSASPYCFNDD